MRIWRVSGDAIAHCLERDNQAWQVGIDMAINDLDAAIRKGAANKIGATIDHADATDRRFGVEAEVVHAATTYEHAEDAREQRKVEDAKTS